MIISDLNHLEVVESREVVGGGDVANAGDIKINIKKSLKQMAYNTLAVTAVNIQKSPLSQTAFNEGSQNTNVTVKF
jgi:hypothetical protein